MLLTVNRAWRHNLRDFSDTAKLLLAQGGLFNNGLTATALVASARPWGRLGSFP